MLDPSAMQTIEFLAHASEIVVSLFVILPVAWKVFRVANRILDVMKDFPPHRHVNGQIIFADGFEPTQPQTLQRS